MNVVTASFRQAMGSIRLLGLMYSITLVLALLAALPFYNTLKAEDQDSLAFLKLLNGFDYTVYSDFMHRSQRAVSPLVSVGRWLGLVYLFLSIFFAGGILTRFAQPLSPFHIGLFWQACTHYTGRFLRLFGVTFLFVIVGAGLWLVIGSLVGVALSDTFTERGQFWIGAVFFALFALTAMFLLCIGDYAKVLMVREDEHRAFYAFGRAGRLVFRALSRTFGLYCLIALIGAGIFGIYFLIDAAVLMSSWLSILLMLVIQQSLIFARIGLKVWSLGVAYTVYGNLLGSAPVTAELLITSAGSTANSLEN